MHEDPIYKNRKQTPSIPNRTNIIWVRGIKPKRSMHRTLQIECGATKRERCKIKHNFNRPVTI